MISEDILFGDSVAHRQIYPHLCTEHVGSTGNSDTGYIIENTSFRLLSRLCHYHSVYLCPKWKYILHRDPHCVICSIYSTICLGGNVVSEDWWCLQDYIKRVIRYNNEMRFIIFISALQVVCSGLSGDLCCSGRLFKQSCFDVVLSHSCLLWFFLCLDQ